MSKDKSTLPLTLKQDRFAREYVANGGNARQAAIKAGYPEHAATSIASETRRKPHVAKRIQDLQKDQLERLEMDGDALVRYLEAALKLDPFDWLDINGKGDLVLKEDEDGKPMKPPKEVRVLISEIWKTGHGIRIKFVSKEAALNILAKKHGLLTDDTKDFDLNASLREMINRADTRESKKPS